MISMFDSIEPGEIPAQAAAVAGYLNGDWVTAPALREHFPHAHLLTITVTASADAQALDVENGDATPGQAIPWVRRQHERGEQRPVIYANASTMPGVIEALRAAGIARGSVRLWSAHYSGPHICGPATCRYPGVPACDGTQWSNRALNRNLDISMLRDDFFQMPVQSNWTEKLVQTMPTVGPGGRGAAIRTVQGLCCARGHSVTIDGDFGPKTEAAVRACQQAAGVVADGTVGQVTWSVLVTGSASSQ